MENNKVDVYRKLQIHLDKMPIGFPSTKSGLDLKILKKLFNPEQALMATKLDWKWKSLGDIFRNIEGLKYSLEDLELFLDKMVAAGTLNFKRENGKKLYANAPMMVGMYEYQLSHLTKDLVKDFFHYIKEAFGYEVMRTKISQLRTIPIEQSLSPEIGVLTYENFRKIIDNTRGPIGVTECICKVGRDLTGKPCKVTERRELCMATDWLAQLYIEQGWARKISKTEALEILRQNEKEGLIINIENTQDPHFFCGCCACCCGLTAGLKKYHNPAEIAQSNYFAKVDQELCIGCGNCIERCQMEAITIKEDIAYVKKNRCIGCGNCILVCTQEAIKLQEKEIKVTPPKDSNELYNKILEKKRKLKEKYLFWKSKIAS